MRDSAKADTVKFLRLIRHAQSAANAGLPATSPDSISLTKLGHSQAQTFADRIASAPGLVVASPFERAIHTALPLSKRFPDAPLEIWPVEEFTYLSPSRFAGTTQRDRKPVADAYWIKGDKEEIDGPGAESFVDLLRRAEMTLGRLAIFEASNILVFCHGQLIRCGVVHPLRRRCWHAKNMRLFRKLDTKDPLPNCAGYDLELRDGRWKVLHLVGQDGEVKFIDEFCSDQDMAPIPPTVMTREPRDSLEAIRNRPDDIE
jgi:broad specificity phosphatase PhoE